MPQIYCSICGAPVLETDSLTDDAKEWLTKVYLLTTVHETASGTEELDGYWPSSYKTYFHNLGPDPPDWSKRHVCKLDARSDGTSSFLIEDSDSSGKGKKVCAMYHRAPGTPLYLPVHQSCMKLAELFINAYKWRQLRRSVVPEYDIASDKILWDVLHRRLYGADPHTQQWELPEPHDYFGGKRCRNTEWEPDNDSKEGIILEYDPMADIPGLTGHILSNLQELQEDDWSDSEDSTYGTLSLQEMKSLQEQSYQILVHPTTFPWLWELDKNEVSERKGKKEGSWDWSLLVESLLRRGIHEADTKILELPDQLKNRRRIWRVLEEARIGDVAQKWEEQRLWEEQPGPIKSLR